MIKLICFIFLIPIWCHGQISFIKQYLAYDAVQRISRPLELPNGNFVCSAIVSKDHIWVNIIYLFSECGELIATLPISTTEEYMVISDLMIYDTQSFLATGYSSDSTLHTINLVLDNQTLEQYQDKRFFGGGVIDAGHSVQDNGKIYQAGVTGYTIVSTVMNHSLNRNIHLYRNYEDLADATFESVFFINSLPNRIYTLERYKNPDTDQRYDVLQCQDQKLQPQFKIGGYTDTSYTTIKGRIGFLEKDTVLIAIEDRNLDGQIIHKYIRKYYRDSIIWQKEMVEFTGFSTYSACGFDSGVLKCVSGNGIVAWFDRQGEEILFNDHLPTVLGGATMFGAILTHDGGLFNCTPTYANINGESRPILRIVKTTSDYDISETPHPKCIVSTNTLGLSEGIHLFPNPASNEINVNSENLIYQFKLFNAASQLLMADSPNKTEFKIKLDLPPGYYSLLLNSRKGITTQRFLIIN